jgi:AcrR family transcriptional regulator
MIVQATLPLVLENGDMVTTRQIADAAGIAEGTIFRAFADKDELLAAVIDAALDAEPYERALGQIDPTLALEATTTKAVEVVQRRVVDVWRLASSIGTRFHDRAKRPMLDSPALVGLLERHRDELEVPPLVAARTLRALTIAMSHPMMNEKPAAARTIAHQFLYGAARGGA